MTTLMAVFFIVHAYRNDFFSFQYCNQAISQGYSGFEERLEGRTTESRTFEGDSVTIRVQEGWVATFDRKDPKV